MKLIWLSGVFPGGPVFRIPCCQCRGHGFDHWSGNGGIKKKSGDQLNRGKKYMGEKNQPLDVQFYRMH